MSANTEQRRQSKANWKIDDPGAGGVIPGDRTGTCAITTATTETRTVDSPSKVNLHLTLNLETDGGTCTLTVTNYIGTDDSLVLDDAGDFVVLQSVYTGTGTLGWKAVASNDLENMSVQTVTADTLHIGLISSTDNGEYDQETNIGTGVTVTTAAGVITTQAAATGEGEESSFVVTYTGMSGYGALVLLSPMYNGTTGTPVVTVGDKADDSFTVLITNVHASEDLNGTFYITYRIDNTGSL